MAFLPPELIIAIARLLCIHCQDPSAYPTAEHHHVHSDKQALARLCLASRAFCAIARPILYHFFVPRWPSVHSAQLAESEDALRRTKDGWAPREVPKLEDNLPRFLHTLTLNPDLAAQLVSIHLSPRVPCPEFRRGRGLDAAALAPPADGKISWISWLMCFTAKCPRLSTVVVDLTVHRYISLDDLDPDVRYFPSLRRVTVVARPEDWVFYELRFIIESARNLDEFVCRAPSLQPTSHHHGPSSTDTAAVVTPRDRGIKSFLSVDFLPIEYLAFTPEVLDQLEWFECYQRRDGDSDSAVLPVSLLSHSLRGLCIDYGPQIGADPEGVPTLFPDVWSLEGPSPLIRLEHLSVYCDILSHAAQLRSSDPTDLLVQLLPPSIKTLRISWVDTDLGLSLKGLAEVARQRFPQLEKVGVGFSEAAIAKECSSGLNGTSIVNSIRSRGLFAKQGVKMGWAIDTWRPSSSHPRSVACVGDDGGVALTAFPLTLEGPEWHLAGDHDAQDPWPAVHDAWLAVRGPNSP